MYYILYISAAASTIDQAGLENILYASRRNNRGNSISGLLLYGNNNFIQLLEGTKEKVISTFNRIRVDRRHLDVTVIASGEMQERCFPRWEMGFQSLRPESFSGLEDFIRHAKTASEKNDCQLPVTLLQAFVRKMKII
ncbi:MAG: BLUF domain-containing protein [Mucilaginibacter sp.]